MVDRMLRRPKRGNRRRRARNFRALAEVLPRREDLPPLPPRQHDAPDHLRSAALLQAGDPRRDRRHLGDALHAPEAGRRQDAGLGA